MEIENKKTGEIIEDALENFARILKISGGSFAMFLKKLANEIEAQGGSVRNSQLLALIYILSDQHLRVMKDQAQKPEYGFQQILEMVNGALIANDMKGFVQELKTGLKFNAFFLKQYPGKRK